MSPFHPFFSHFFLKKGLRNGGFFAINCPLMAKKSKIAQNNHRIRWSAQAAPKREALRSISKDVSVPLTERMAARAKLAAMPRNTAETRVRHRCVITGRPRGNFRKFGLCRIKFRELAHNGDISGVTKSSW